MVGRRDMSLRVSSLEPGLTIVLADKGQIGAIYFIASEDDLPVRAALASPRFQIDAATDRPLRAR
jgi:hypothetical protein